MGFLALVVRDQVLQWKISQSLGGTQPLSLKGICGNNVVLCAVHPLHGRLRVISCLCFGMGVGEIRKPRRLRGAD